ncbi:MAG TPA: ABC transporter substrate-binding protein [Candidatus Aquilonibacter sp.]|nr:ABC transporter substrate-binding protein [Candidatus Aquilonibacter sp.]
MQQLRVSSALPDPPFEFYDNGAPSGFDVALTQAIAREIGRAWTLVPFSGDSFEAIFDGLGASADLVASGTTITPERQARARFCAPYLRSGQSLVVNINATPHATSLDALGGLAVGIQKGNTSEAVAQQLLAQGKIARIAWYAYHDIDKALGDLEAGRIGAIIKLEPVMRALTATRPSLRVVQAGLTVEMIAYCVALADKALADDINAAQQTLLANGTIEALANRFNLLSPHTEIAR